MLNSAFEGLPDAIDPALSRQNHASRLAKTARLTGSGAMG